MTTQHRSLSAYLYGYECAITGKAKPVSRSYQYDVDNGYADGKQDLHKQMLAAFEQGTVQ